MSQLDLPQIAESQALAYVTSNDADAKLEAALCEDITDHDPGSGDITLSDAEFREAWHHVIGGTPPAAFDFIVPAIKRPFMVSNGSGEIATVKTASGASGQVPDGETRLFYCDGTDIYSLTDSLAEGGSGSAAHSGALVLLSADQTIPTSTDTILDWDSESYDTNGFHESVTNPSRLTVPAGITKAVLTAQIRWGSNSSGIRQCYVNKNGAASFDGRPVQSMAAQTTPTFQTLLSPVLGVTEGDYFEIGVWQNSGGSRTVDSNVSCWFSIQVVE
ncbi:MAG: hypothetical protein EP348_07280 [Alphaproteobacteria bacterium]|nr:MAG: hypothetical protein EP348_07280 [Alphaproteobacteria bacterium]